MQNSYAKFFLNQKFKIMKRISFVLLLVFTPILCLYAQNGEITGRIRDLITENSIDSTAVTLLRTDSSRVGATYAITELSYTEIDGKPIRDRNPKDGAMFILKVPKPGRYILRCMAVGYKTMYFPIHVKYTSAKTKYDVGDFYLQESFVQLGEAVVKGTKIRMFYKGDTLVYNASAFQLPDGSMLNDLVAQLPGAEIRDGNIYVNGRLVENLLLGGKDFFNGNPRAALASLPAYVAKNVKVYTKKGEKSSMMGSSMGDDQFVMDVHLKRKYIGTYIGQLVAGYGTKDRYQAGFNLMKFNDCQSFSLAGDFNNRSQQFQYARDGERGNAEKSGKHRRNYLTFNYQYEPNGKIRFTMGADYHDNAVHNDEGSSRENFLSGGNTFIRTSNVSYLDNMSVAGRTRLTLRPRKNQFYEIKYSINYLKNHGYNHIRTANYNANPLEKDFYALMDSTFSRLNTNVFLQSILLSRLQNQVHFDSKQLNHQASFLMHNAFGGNLLNVEGEFAATNQDGNRYDLYNLRYSRPTPQTDFRNRYVASQTDSYHYLGKISYDWKYRQTEKADGLLTPYYSFAYDKNCNNNPLYRLDLLGGTWGNFDTSVLGVLPSNTTDLEQVLSSADSYWGHLRQKKHLLGANWQHELKLANRRWLKFNVTAETGYLDSQYNYWRYGNKYPATRHSWLPSPSVRLTYNPIAEDRGGRSTIWVLSASSRKEQVNLYHLIDITDAADPLNVFKGNSQLHDTWINNVSLQHMRRFYKTNTNLYSGISFNFLKNAVEISTIYDRTKGVRTTQPVNVDGNWNAGFNFIVNTPLDKDQRWIIFYMASINAYHSADLSYTTTGSHNEKYNVDRLDWSTGIMLQSHPTAWLNLSSSFTAFMNNIRGSRPQFEKIHTTTLLYGLQAIVNLPAKFILYANCDFASRFGYNDASLNETRANIETSLERSIKNFTLKFQACDLLARNLYTTNSIDAQGRTESFATTIPRYFFFSLTWRFNKVANRK